MYMVDSSSTQKKRRVPTQIERHRFSQAHHTLHLYSDLLYEIGTARIHMSVFDNLSPTSCTPPKKGIASKTSINIHSPSPGSAYPTEYDPSRSHRHPVPYTDGSKTTALSRAPSHLRIPSRWLPC